MSTTSSSSSSSSSSPSFHMRLHTLFASNLLRCQVWGPPQIWRSFFILLLLLLLLFRLHLHLLFHRRRSKTMVGQRVRPKSLSDPPRAPPSADTRARGTMRPANELALTPWLHLHCGFHVKMDASNCATTWTNPRYSSNRQKATTRLDGWTVQHAFQIGTRHVNTINLQLGSSRPRRGSTHRKALRDDY